MRIVVTGVAGFIGSNLAARLLKEGHSVIGIDNFSYGFERNLAPIVGHKDFKLIRGDVRDSQTLHNAVGDCIVHLASHKIPRYSSALSTLADNSKMLSILIDKCLREKIRFVFASTSDIYGKNPNIPYHEDSDSLLGPTTVKRWAYALSKIYGEQLIQAYHQDHQLEYTIMRFFGSYGINQNLTWWGGPQSVFIQNILEGKPIEIHGDGSQTRTFTYIDDTVDGIYRCIVDPRAVNQIFNIAGNPDQEITILGLAKLINQLIKGTEEADIVFVPYSAFGKYEDVMRRVPSIDKIKSRLDFTPQFKLEDGLRKTIEWQRSL